MNGFHHLRRRMHARSPEPFPARSALVRALDYFMYAVGLLAPLALLPQIIQLYSNKSSTGLSLLTWSLLVLVNLLWAMYAAVHRDHQLLLANALLMCFNFAIVVGILMY